MSATLPNIDTSVRKNALNKDLCSHALAEACHLSATMETPLTSDLERKQQADAAAMGWNAVNASAGSFPDEYSTL